MVAIARTMLCRQPHCEECQSPSLKAILTDMLAWMIRSLSPSQGCYRAKTWYKIPKNRVSSRSWHKKLRLPRDCAAGGSMAQRLPSPPWGWRRRSPPSPAAGRRRLCTACRCRPCRTARWGTPGPWCPPESSGCPPCSWEPAGHIFIKQTSHLRHDVSGRWQLYAACNTHSCHAVKVR